MQHPRRFLLYYLLIVFSILFSVCLFNYIHDPCMVFSQHNKPLLHEYKVRTVFNKARYGIYDTAIIGSSTSTISFEPIVNSIFGGKSLNLAIHDTTSHISHAMMRRTIDKKSIKRVIYAYDLFIYNEEERWENKQYYQSESGIYDKFKYLMDLKLAIIQIKKLSNNTKIEKYKFTQPSFFSNHFALRHIPTNKELNIKNVDILVKLISDTPQAHFCIYFTPYHIMWWYQASKMNELDNYFEIKRATIKRLLPLKNVSLYDFQNIDEIIFDIPSFWDSIHSLPHINEKVLNFIKEDKYRVSSNYSSHSFETDMRSKIKRFEKENEQSIIEYKVEQDLERIKKNLDYRRERL